MYNVKIKDFGGGQIQTRIYSHLVYTGQKKRPDKNMTAYEINPFDGEKTRVVSSFKEIDRNKEKNILDSLKRAKGKIYDYARANYWEWFITLTLNPEKVDRYDYSACSKKVSKWLQNMKLICPDFKYLVVPELHKDGAYHFHALFSNCDDLGFIPSGHYTDSGDIIYNIGKYRFGFTTATVVKNNDAVTKYVTKYVTKDLVEHIPGKRKYWHSKNLDLPVEETGILDSFDIEILKTELCEDSVYFKESGYDVLLSHRTVTYIENDLSICNEEE